MILWAALWFAVKERCIVVSEEEQQNNIDEFNKGFFPRWELLHSNSVAVELGYLTRQRIVASISSISFESGPESTPEEAEADEENNRALMQVMGRVFADYIYMLKSGQPDKLDIGTTPTILNVLMGQVISHADDPTVGKLILTLLLGLKQL